MYQGLAQYAKHAEIHPVLTLPFQAQVPVDTDEHRASIHSQNSFEAADNIEEEDTVSWREACLCY